MRISSTDVAAGRAATVRLVYDRSRDRARASIDAAEAALRAYNRQWGTQRLLLRGIAPQVALPLEIEGVDLATPQQSGALILFLVAYYGLFASLMGGMALALDATAGERERGSLEPLLATPASPLEIATGKWLAIAGFDATRRTAHAGGLLPDAQFRAAAGGRAYRSCSAPAELLRFLLVLAPLVALLPAALLYMGARGRTLKEAQANVSLLLFIVSMMPVVQLFLQKREPPWLLWVPISSQYTLLSRALRGDAIRAARLAAKRGHPAGARRRSRWSRWVECCAASRRWVYAELNHASWRSTTSGGWRSALRVPSQPASATPSAPPTIPISHTHGFQWNGIWKARSART